MGYRDDIEALRVRLALLQDERAALHRDRARLLDAVRRIPQVDDELERLRRELHARAPRRLPALDDLRVASPCDARWEDMTGDAQARFCARCAQHVYDLSEMTREAAEALVFTTQGSVCVRYFRRADGTVITADCAVGLRRKRVRLLAAAGAATALAASAAAMALGHGDEARVLERAHAPTRSQAAVEELRSEAVSVPPERPVELLGQVVRPVHEGARRMGRMQVRRR